MLYLIEICGKGRFERFATNCADFGPFWGIFGHFSGRHQFVGGLNSGFGKAKDG